MSGGLMIAAWISPSLGGAAAPDDWQAPARAARRKNPIAADAQSIAAGKEVYTQQCLQCHGTAGKGDGTAAKDLDPKPRNLGAENVVRQTDGALFWKITEGRKPMPSFATLINDEQRWQVINYVRTLAPAAQVATTQP